MPAEKRDSKTQPTRIQIGSGHLKVSRLSIFIGTPSIFESLILKQIDLYCKTIMTHGLHLD